MPGLTRRHACRARLTWILYSNSPMHKRVIQAFLTSGFGKWKSLSNTDHKLASVKDVGVLGREPTTRRYECSYVMSRRRPVKREAFQQTLS